MLAGSRAGRALGARSARGAACCAGSACSARADLRRAALDREVGQLGADSSDALSPSSRCDRSSARAAWRAEELLGRQEQRLGRQQRPLGVALQQAVARSRVSCQKRWMRRFEVADAARACASARQVVEHRRRLIEEQRQVVLDAGRGDAVADVLVDRGSWTGRLRSSSRQRLRKRARAASSIGNSRAGQQAHFGHRVQRCAGCRGRRCGWNRSRRRTKDIGNGIAPAGIEYYLPLFFDATATLFDYLPRDSRASRCTATSTRRIAALLAGHRDRATACCAATARGRCCRREALFLPTEEFFARAEAASRGSTLASRGDAGGCASCRRRCPTCAVDRRADDPLRALQALPRPHRHARADRAPRARAGARRCSSTSPSTASAAALCDALAGVPRRRREARRSRVAPLARGLRVAATAAHRVRHRGRAVRRRRRRRAGASARTGAATSTRWCATCPR